MSFCGLFANRVIAPSRTLGWSPGESERAPARGEDELGGDDWEIRVHFSRHSRLHERMEARSPPIAL